MAVVAATLVAGALTGEAGQTFGATGRPLQAATLLLAVAATAVLVALRRAGPRVGGPRRVATATTVGLARLVPIAATTPLPATRGVSGAVPALEAVPLAIASLPLEGTGAPAARTTAALPFPPIPATALAAPQGLVAVVRAVVAPTQETVPEGEGHEVVATPESPPARPLGPVGGAGVVPLEGRPEGGARPLPAAAVGGRRAVATPTAAARRCLRAPVALGVQKLPPSALQRQEATRRVPQVPTGATPVAALAVAGPPVVIGSAAATPCEAVASGAQVKIPTLPIAATASKAAPTPLRGTGLGGGVALVAEEDPVPFPAPRKPLREAATAAVGAATAMTLARQARIRGAAPTVVAASAPPRPPVVAAATKARARLTRSRAKRTSFEAPASFLATRA